MKKMIRILVKCFLAVVVFSALRKVWAAPHHRKAVSLYNGNDTLTQLEYFNINSTLYQKDTAFIVEFYSSWCGHCVHFAPLWRRLASQTFQWSNVIRVAAINCASEENFPVCTSFEIRGFPTVKLFPAMSLPGQKGLEVKVSDADPERIVELYERKMLEFVEMHLGSQRPSAWPVFRELEKDVTLDSINNVFSEEGIGAVVLVFHSASSYSAKRTTLDISSDPKIRTLGVDVDVFQKENPRFLLEFNSGKVPSAHLLLPNPAKSFWSSNKKVLVVPLNVDTADSSALQARLKELLPWSQVGLTHVPQLPIKSFVTSPAPPVPKGVFMSDLLKMIRYALRQEIGMLNILEGEDLKSAKEFVALLVKYFPGDTDTMAYLNTLNVWLRSVGSRSVSNREWLKRIRSRMTREDPLFVEEWVGCRGSRETLRGYPCATWTLFHVLSVLAADANARVDEEKAEGREVLDVMAGYIQSFFSCRECASHFEEMIKEDLDDSVQSYDDVILWLWKAHNKVNARLAGDESEDPLAPKIQFPDFDTCPSCRIEGNRDAWHYLNAKTFLKNYYSNISVFSADELAFPTERTGPRNAKSHRRRQGINSIEGEIIKPVLRPGGIAEIKRRTREKKLRTAVLGSHLDVERLRAIERQTRRRNPTSSPFGGVLGFTDWDVSICFGAYGVCFVVLLALYIIYVDRRCRKMILRKSSKASIAKILMISQD